MEKKLIILQYLIQGKVEDEATCRGYALKEFGCV